ncbi:uncharacterized protein MONBRDRAFT_30897 [Monosiga brevicollis MX1]|uniref:Transcriptional coactivator p15 (PC4) C-terminal domain-containing protein n=1 Tax=Monosiga brevicollis TaxID=81824 RepID=A9UQ10_MONBE|nr:uncharacterized protein MONBRDRAFT_30897 [Monosiga brevicollis MX1]EDQ92514.1 predicted protein [Monosiga brevicollis MX1]|eukprot:XP_001742276.1 hypothetical protein [Monosiga brevicollis MX1]
MSDDPVVLKRRIALLVQENEILRARLATYEGAADDTTASSAPAKRPKVDTQATREAFDNQDALLDDEDNPYFPLSNNKRVTVSRFKAFTLIRLGEVYNDNGKTKQGKGISLKASEWETLKEISESAEKAFAENNKDFTASLGETRNGLRRLTISDFRDKLYYNIREFYKDRSDEWKPTKKGCMLTEDQWSKLMDVVPALDAAIAELSEK